MKRLNPLCIALALLPILLFSGCSGGDSSSATQTKVNVFTSQKFVAKDFVVQLEAEEYVTMITDMTGNLEEAGECPAETPDFIVQYQLAQGGVDYWWLWSDSDGTLTLVNQSVDEKKAYHSTKITSHDWGKMIEKATDGKGPV